MHYALAHFDGASQIRSKGISVNSLLRVKIWCMVQYHSVNISDSDLNLGLGPHHRGRGSPFLHVSDWSNVTNPTILLAEIEDRAPLCTKDLFYACSRSSPVIMGNIGAHSLSAWRVCVGDTTITIWFKERDTISQEMSSVWGNAMFNFFYPLPL